MSGLSSTSRMRPRAGPPDSGPVEALAAARSARWRWLFPDGTTYGLAAGAGDDGAGGGTFCAQPWAAFDDFTLSGVPFGSSSCAGAAASCAMAGGALRPPRDGLGVSSSTTASLGGGTSRSGGASSASAVSAGMLGANRQCDGKCGTLTDDAVDPDLSAVRFGDVL